MRWRVAGRDHPARRQRRRPPDAAAHPAAAARRGRRRGVGDAPHAADRVAARGGAGPLGAAVPAPGHPGAGAQRTGVPPPLRRPRRVAGRQHRRGARPRGAAAGADARHRDGLHRERDPVGRPLAVRPRARDGAGHHDLQPVQRPGAGALAVPRLAVGALRGDPGRRAPGAVDGGEPRHAGRLRLPPAPRPAGAPRAVGRGGAVADRRHRRHRPRDRRPGARAVRGDGGRDPGRRRRGGARRHRHRADGAGERQVPDPGAPPRDARRARRRPPADDRAGARAARPVHLPRRRQPQGARPRGGREPHGHQGLRPAAAAHQRGADPAPALAAHRRGVLRRAP